MLEEFGLTNAEEKVYLVLLGLGESKASALIKKTQLHRTTVYDVLGRLIEKGFVSYIFKNRVKSYVPSDVSKLVDLANEDKKLAEEKYKLAKRLLKKIVPPKRNGVNVTAQIFEGRKGEKTIMRDIIDEGKEFYIIGSGGSFRGDMPSYTEQWAEQRRRKKIHAKILSTNVAGSPEWGLNKIRRLSKTYNSLTATVIYGNKIAFFIHESPIIILLIENEKLSDDYRVYFNLLWKISES